MHIKSQKVWFRIQRQVTGPINRRKYYDSFFDQLQPGHKYNDTIMVAVFDSVYRIIRQEIMNSLWTRQIT